MAQRSKLYSRAIDLGLDISTVQRMRTIDIKEYLGKHDIPEEVTSYIEPSELHIDIPSEANNYIVSTVPVNITVGDDAREHSEPTLLPTHVDSIILQYKAELQEVLQNMHTYRSLMNGGIFADGERHLITEALCQARTRAVGVCQAMRATLLPYQRSIMCKYRAICTPSIMEDLNLKTLVDNIVKTKHRIDTIDMTIESYEKNIELLSYDD